MTEFTVPEITIGSDPELFVRERSSGRLVSAHDLMPGTKENPHPVYLGAIQVDGVAAEFNTNPALTASDFGMNIFTVMDALKSTLGGRYELVMEPVAIFPKEYWSTLPKKTKELGCNPDFNGWTMSVNPPPDTTDNPTMRTASGHIHIGWGKNFDPKDSNHFNDCCIVAKQMDYFLGIQSLLWDDDPRRRTMYGKAGTFRPKPYGMEYRTLSNKWLEDKQLIQWVWLQAYYGISGLFQGNILEQTFGDAAKTIIDNNITDWSSMKEYSRLASHVSMPPVNRKKKEVKAKSKFRGLKETYGVSEGTQSIELIKEMYNQLTTNNESNF